MSLETAAVEKNQQTEKVGNLESGTIVVTNDTEDGDGDGDGVVVETTITTPLEQIPTTNKTITQAKKEINILILFTVERKRAIDLKHSSYDKADLLKSANQEELTLRNMVEKALDETRNTIERQTLLWGLWILDGRPYPE